MYTVNLFKSTKGETRKFVKLLLEWKLKNEPHHLYFFEQKKILAIKCQKWFICIFSITLFCSRMVQSWHIAISWHSQEKKRKVVISFCELLHRCMSHSKYIQWLWVQTTELYFLGFSLALPITTWEVIYLKWDLHIFGNGTSRNIIFSDNDRKY